MEILSFTTLHSTNTYALELAKQGAEAETVVWAKKQTAGRGQYDRSFVSPPGGLYFSLILHPELPLHTLPLVTLAAGLGCCYGLEKSTLILPRLKWPNDLYVHGKKIGGILTEVLPANTNGTKTVIIGVGLNMNNTVSTFVGGLEKIVTTVADCTCKKFDLLETLELIVREIVQQVRFLKDNQDKLLAQWQQRDYLKGQLLEWDNGHAVVSGIGQGILTDGRYSLLDGSGTRYEILAGTVRPLKAVQDEHKL